MTYDLVLARVSLEASAERLVQLDPAERRRRAVVAARDYDLEGLWVVVEARLVLQGRAGARVSPRTLESYRQGLSALLRWAQPAGVSLLRPRPDEGSAYARWLEGQQYSPSTVNVRLAAARSVYAALRWAGATEASPFSDVRGASDPTPRWEKRAPYTNAEIDTLLNHADPQERVYVLLGADCGLRNSEMSSLRRENVHLGGEQPRITVLGKGGRRQSVGLSRRAEQALQLWLTATPDFGPWVLRLRSRSGIRDSLIRLCRRANVRYEGREVHGLRHTAGTRTYSETTDLLAVRDHLRHASTETSEIYVQYARKGKAVNRDW